MRTDFIDYPTAWELVRTTAAVHHPRCSYTDATWGTGVTLCDCNVLMWAWARHGGTDPERYATTEDA